MQSTQAARRAWPGTLAMTLVLLGLLVMPVPASAARTPSQPEVAAASAGWHGRAVQNPRPHPRLARADWPRGWSARSVGLGTGYSRPGGSDRVREVQRRLTRLGYRPGPVDGLFGPRTRAATRWFQYKHSLPLTGRVSRSTLAVLQARSDHRPLPVATPAKAKKKVRPKPVQPIVQQPVRMPGDRGDVTWLLAAALLLAALGLGVVASFAIPELRRTRATPATTPPPPPPAKATPVPRTPPRADAPRVIGYAMVGWEDAAESTEALARQCARRGWSLAEVIHDPHDPASSLIERRGLVYVLNAISSHKAAGLVVARIRDFTYRIVDLATLLSWVADADAFVAAADHELDTSTGAGRGTARAVVDLARWERDRTRLGRFTPADWTPGPDLAHQLALMHDDGRSLRAIADALNLVGITAPDGRTGWRAADVRSATEEARSR
jgi:peptidoglycan hydrolase-like protein with peptidoglycan-binding domain